MKGNGAHVQAMGPMNDADDRRELWDRVYSAKRADQLSWFQPAPDLSLKLIRRTGVARHAHIVDVGGGASTLVDHLLREGFTNLAVLDISAAALAQSQQRLGAEAARVEWIVADATAWRPEQPIDLWHDRAVLHFLTEPADQQAYAAVLSGAVPAHGWAVIGGFAPGAPLKCSGLDIVQHDAASLGALLGPGFELLETHGEIHLTPWGAEQAFRYHVFRRRR